MADSWEDLDASFGWKPAGESAPAPAWDDLDSQIKKSVRSYDAQKVKPVDPPRVPDSDFEGSTLQFGPIDTKIPLPNGVAKGLAQIGSGFADWGMGSAQLMGNATKEDAGAKRALDKPLNEGIMGTINSFAGKLAPTLTMPAGLLPNAMRGFAPVVEGLATGAVQGAFEPVAPGESRGANMAVASGAGALLPGAMALARRGAAPEPSLAPLIASAEREGIPLGVADTTRNKLVKAFRSVANDTPITGGSNQTIREEQQEAFNKAMGARWGSNATKHTPAVRDADKARIVKDLDEVWSKNELPYDANLFGTLQKMEADVTKLPEAEGKAVQKWIDDINNKVVVKPNGDLYLPGDVVNSMQKDIFKKFGKGNDERSVVMMQLRGELIDHFNQGVTGPEAAKLTAARGQYRAFKSVEDALKKSDLGVAGREMGDIRPTDASAGILRTYNRNPAGSPFGDLPRIGQQFLVDRTAQTGGSPKALIQNSAIGAGVLGGVGVMSLPAAGALAGGFIAGNKALSSPAIRRAIQNPVVTRALLDNSNTAAATREALQSMVRRAPAAGALGALSSAARAEEE